MGAVVMGTSLNKFGIYDIGKGFAGMKVAVRVDFNGTVKNGDVSSMNRVDLALPTIEYLQEQGAEEITLLSHNGESLEPLVPVLEKKLSEEVGFEPINATGIERKNRIVLVDNTRTDSRETSKSEQDRTLMAMDIISRFDPDYFVLDGFSVAHRDQASVTTIAKEMIKQGKLAIAGHLLLNEYSFFMDKVINNPEHVYLAFMGGAKIADKMRTMQKLLSKVDKLVIGGAMLYPFLIAAGYQVGKEPISGLKDDVNLAQNILDQYSDKLVLPKKLCGQNGAMINLSNLSGNEEFAMDDFVMRDALADLDEISLGVPFNAIKTVFFNGPFGYSEGGFYRGTLNVLRFMSEMTWNGATTIIGGGETLDAVKVLKKMERIIITWLSSGGGASAELLDKGTLPGFEALSNRP